jgi:polysaccharide export outer membrane protein
MVRSVLAVGILVFGVFNQLVVGQQKTPPSELVQYVRDARKAGLQDGEIKQNATKAGWNADDVNDAIASASASPKHAEGQPGGAADPAASPATPPQPVITGTATAVKDKPENSTTQAAPSEPPASAAEAPAAKDRPAATTSPSPEKPAAAAGGEKTLSVAGRGVSDDYQIGAGDVLHISVWKDPDVSVPVAPVRSDGKISMPLIKEVPVVGLTPAQAEKLIAEQLSKFKDIAVADVTVGVTQINSKKIYLIGGVKREGPMNFTYRMTVMQAISEAGGLTDYAKRKKIYVLRDENGRQFRLPFNYDAVLKGEHMELNILLMPGDTLVVPH